MAYLYFLSCANVPLSLYDYGQKLHAREQALRRTLISATISNRQLVDLSEIYELLSSNEVCLDDSAAAEKHMQAALDQFDPKLLNNKERIATIYLKNANLNRDLDKFNLAKVNYDCSLDYIGQIAFGSSINEVPFNSAAVNFNNLGILYFLMAQKNTNLEQRRKYYLIARDNFVRAKYLMFVIGSGKNQCFQQNIDENLNQCLIEMQFSD